MENFVKRAKDCMWVLGILATLFFGYFDIMNRINKTEDRALTIEKRLDTSFSSLYRFYEFYRHNECALLTVEKENNEYAKLTYQQLCVSGIYK